MIFVLCVFMLQQQLANALASALVEASGPGLLLGILAERDLR